MATSPVVTTNTGRARAIRDSVYPDGSPLPPHTYDYVQYDPLGNDYILFKGQTEWGRMSRQSPYRIFSTSTR